MTVDDLRELVARAMEPYYWDSFYDDFPDNDWNQMGRRLSLEKADAVLQALTEAGRLLPELPEGWQVSRVFEIKGAPVTTYCAIVYRPHRDGWWAKSGQGTGPTIPLALADALANGGDDGTD